MFLEQNHLEIDSRCYLDSDNVKLTHIYARLIPHHLYIITWRIRVKLDRIVALAAVGICITLIKQLVNLSLIYLFGYLFI